MKQFKMLRNEDEINNTLRKRKRKDMFKYC